MKPIFDFIDYRKFLAAYYESKKETSHFFSYRYFSRKLGINSPSFLKHVIDGKRNLTTKMIDRFSHALDLSVKESRYFRNLVLFNQAKTAGEKQEHYAVLRSVIGMVKETVLGADQYDYFSTWYTPVIREMICLRDFNNDYRAIAATLKPPILPSEAKAAVALLLRLKLVERQAEGKYRQTSSAITADSAVTSLAVRSFTRVMFDHAKVAPDTVGKTERHVSGLTMGISQEAYDVIAAEIESFKDRVKLIVNRDQGGSRIYQLNIGMFPVSEDLRTLPVEQEGAQ
ncbi:MAG: TIGR02147 family protein [Chitinispirillaceae bacterium]|nr:TIGR02147 family protein [Chitinispirillaceae bacterium]